MTDHISDERLNQLEHEIEYIEAQVGMQNLTKSIEVTEIAAIIARLRAAEARLKQSTQCLADPHCQFCGGLGVLSAASDMPHPVSVECVCTLPSCVKGGGK